MEFATAQTCTTQRALACPLRPVGRISVMLTSSLSKFWLLQSSSYQHQPIHIRHLVVSHTGFLHVAVQGGAHCRCDGFTRCQIDEAAHLPGRPLARLPRRDLGPETGSATEGGGRRGDRSLGRRTSSQGFASTGSEAIALRVRAAGLLMELMS